MAVEKELIALRIEKNISRKEMAEVIGVTPETYRKKELGENDWWGTEMFLVANKFNKRIDDIFLNKKSTKGGLDKAS
ncbi:helix-turn-helix transcriptional regulator [Lactococcus sp. DD01]|uniref:helix-turn-helix transcriptional regulator n=1 Tax=Lactococcus sp. DD01 TaxID=1776443 RepID=UPI0007765388|nr:helix-turn-helix domain-containing protein [Lactococcus sp. DD01]KXT63188.1 Transcriptional regulator [Lactococcus sp. DD01]